MCLSTVTRVYAKPDLTERWGWKILERKDRGGLAFPFCQSCCGVSHPLKIDKWMQAKGKEIQRWQEAAYPAGFHLFRSKKAAQQWVGVPVDSWKAEIVQVRYRGLVCEGQDDGYKVVVARELYVPDPKETV